MKPYVPLGILYICSHLRKKGVVVEVFDTTFSTGRSYLTCCAPFRRPSSACMQTS